MRKFVMSMDKKLCKTEKFIYDIAALAILVGIFHLAGLGVWLIGGLVMKNLGKEEKAEKAEKSEEK